MPLLPPPHFIFLKILLFIFQAFSEVFTKALPLLFCATHITYSYFSWFMYSLLTFLFWYIFHLTS